MALGLYEPQTVSAIRREVKLGMVVCDIGAQSGYFSLIMGLLLKGTGGMVHAFEPLPASFDILELNTLENDLADTIKLHRIAVSAMAGCIQMQEVSNMLVASNVESAVSIECKTLDEMLGERRVDFVKIDIEGHELSALSGASRILKRDRPTILIEVGEFWLRKAGYSSIELFEMLYDLGYGTFALDGSPIHAAELEISALSNIEILARPR